MSVLTSSQMRYCFRRQSWPYVDDQKEPYFAVLIQHTAGYLGLAMSGLPLGYAPETLISVLVLLLNDIQPANWPASRRCSV